MTTLKLSVVPAKILKDGTHKIRIAVGHKQETRYLVTRYKIDSLNQFRNGNIVNRKDASILNVKLRELLNNYQYALDKIYTDDYEPAQIIEYLKNYKGNTYGAYTLQLALEEYINEKINSNKLGTAGHYKFTLKYLNEFSKDEILLEMLTPRIIKSIENYLIHKGLGPTTIGMHMINLRTVINESIRNKIVSYETNPFEYWKKPDPVQRELDITIDELKLIRDSDYKEKNLRMARDLFMLSYYLGGINLIDLMEINFKNAKIVEYVRTKTQHTKKGNKKTSLSIPDEAKPIIKTWIGRNGKLDFGYKYSYNNFRNYVTKEIQRLSDKLGINKRVVYYSARKSLTQHGFEMGISLEVLEYCIGQSMKSNRPIFNYVKIMREHADKAMRTILDNIK